jgi:hypothetical protein
MADTLGPLHKADGLAAHLLGTQPLTLRIDLEPTGTDQPARAFITAGPIRWRT